MRSILIKNQLIGLIIFLGLLSCSKDYQANETAKVHIKKEGDNFTLYRNGTPFSIQGASGNSHFQELRSIGGNTIRVYDTLRLKEVLDNAKNAKLAVIVDLSLPDFSSEGTFYHNKQQIAQLTNGYKKLVRKHAKHPALLAWNLGNEVNYPIRPKYDYFFNVFNDLITIIHENDPDHPVTTTLSRHLLRRRILSLRWHSPGLDFISINVFGKLKDLQKDLDGISWFWDGPYLLSEWGINGPWESNFTSWQAPIEATSTKKSDFIKERYNNFIATKSNNCIGNLVFYWGQKQESTHTWYSLFDYKGRKTPMIHEIQKLWKKNFIKNPAPQIDYMLVDQKGALDNCIFKPNTIKNATIVINSTPNDSLLIEWELLPENWGYNLGENQYRPPALKGFINKQDGNTLIFETPKREGAYRLFSYVYDRYGNVATANTPFYVLKSAHD